jgi:hypothetical protein
VVEYHKYEGVCKVKLSPFFWFFRFIQKIILMKKGLTLRDNYWFRKALQCLNIFIIFLTWHYRQGSPESKYSDLYAKYSKNREY